MDTYARLAPGESAWHLIQPGMQRVIARCGLSEKSVESIKHALATAGAFLFLADEGWFIVQPKPNHIEVLAAAGDAGAFARYMPQVDALAADVGAEYMQFKSPRPGWRRRAKQLGWAVADTNGREVTYRKYYGIQCQ